MVSSSFLLLLMLFPSNVYRTTATLFNLFESNPVEIHRKFPKLNCSEVIDTPTNATAIYSSKGHFEHCLHRCLYLNSAITEELIFIPPTLGDIFKIKFQFAVNNLISLTNDGSLDLMVTIYVYWSDPRIAWNESQIPISYTRLELSLIWHPIFALANCKAKSCLVKPQRDYLVYLESDGDAFYEIAQLIKANCVLDLKLFPFDSQTCNLTFLAVNAYSDELAIQSYPIGFRYFQPECEEWEIVGVKDYGVNFSGFGLNRTKEGNWDFKTEWVLGWAAPGFVVEIWLKRIPAYFIYNLIAPVIIVSLIGFFTVFLPEVSQDKINLAVTVLLSFVFIQSNVEKMIPKSQEIPNLANYILFALILSAVNLIGSIIVVGISNLPKSKPPKPWVRFIIINCLGLLVLKEEAYNTLYQFFKKICCNKASHFNQNNGEITTSDACIEARQSRQNSNSSSKKSTNWREITQVIDHFLLLLYCISSLINFFYMFFPLLCK